MPEWSWEIGKEHKKILGYKCTKATTRFRGRNYTAWFADELPLSYGPMKFGGLPGIILEIEDDKGEVHFTATDFRQAPKNKIMIMWKYHKHKHSNRAKMRKLIRREHMHPHQFAIAMGGKGFLFMDKSNPVTFSVPYNPIELE